MAHMHWIKKRSIGDCLFSVTLYAIFSVFAFICIYPFYYMFINSISANDLSAGGRIFLYPQGVHFTNYVSILRLRGITQSFFISVSRTVIGTLATLLGSTILGYLFSHHVMWGRNFWYRFVIVTMFVNAGLVPYTEINLTNKYQKQGKYDILHLWRKHTNW